jgi:hypothetical protein
MSERNPVYDQPDEHELLCYEAMRGLEKFIKLIPSTRAQRRARASYDRRKARLQAAASSSPAVDAAARSDTPRK